MLPLTCLYDRSSIFCKLYGKVIRPVKIGIGSLLTRIVISIKTTAAKFYQQSNLLKSRMHVSCNIRSNMLRHCVSKCTTDNQCVFLSETTNLLHLPLNVSRHAGLVYPGLVPDTTKFTPTVRVDHL